MPTKETLVRLFRRISLLLLAIPLLIATLGVQTAEAAKPVIVFTTGPGTGAPPETLQYLLVTQFPDDDRPLGEDVTGVGPLTFSSPAIHHKIGDGWATWSHGYTGDVYETDGVKVTLPKRTSGFYFYAEPNEFATITITARTDNGTTSKAIAVDGEGGARFFGFYSRLPYTDFIKSVTVSSDSKFAIGEFGLTGDVGRYVALGDSFSSGEGTGDYFAVTNTPTNKCHRSPDAYGSLLAAGDKGLRPLKFVACSGSITQDLSQPNHLYSGEGPQLDALSALTKTVTLTIGGNDVDFPGVLDACVKARQHADGHGCSTRSEVTEPVQKRLDALAGSGDATAPGDRAITALSSALAAIHVRAPKAKVYFAGYPDLFGSDKSDFRKDKTSPSGYVCDVNTIAAASVDYADAKWINKRTKALNSVVKNAVSAAKKDDSTLKAFYVPPTTFDGHGLCDSKKRWLNKVILVAGGGGDLLGPAPESVHPTTTGQKSGYRKAYEKAGV